METSNQVDPHSHQHDHRGHAHEFQQDYPSEPQRPTREQLAHINGWGADLDRKDRPGVPMERTPPRFIPPPVDRLPQQEQTVEILTSTERPGITPIFGTVQPPKGLSGMIRRAAFRWSENDMRHWLLLLAADRVNVVEGIGEDLSQGKVPNVLAEMGIKAEWEHNRAGLVKKAVVAGAVLGTMVYLMRRRDER
ncbi:LAMTOR1/MEH1 family protein [Massilia sp. 9096]|uniref:LAMTOR1/MEH1 family protein n=1 Tax=Massilia sp. 9096 TaxID=1500894 RepID=UPI00055FDB02|nr:LAMTOR1/MEH1 family protein [Massilia sp. 9096]